MSAPGGTVPGVVLYCLTAAGVAFSLLLFCLLQMHLRALERSVLDRQRAALAAVESLRQTSAQMARDVDSLMAAAASSTPAAPAWSGLNLTRRTQALRMHRRGDSAGDIARALGVPRQEVDLLLKVHRIVIAAVT